MPSMSTINLGTTQSLILDICLSPSEPDMLANCKNDGSIQLISKLFDRKPKPVTKNLEALCSIKIKLFNCVTNALFCFIKLKN